MGLFFSSINILLLSYLLILCAQTTSHNSINNISNNNKTQSFIIRVQNSLKPSQFSNDEEWYTSIIRSLTNQNNNIHTVLHTYRTVFHGFSTKLSQDQALELTKLPEVLAIIPDQLRQLLTTRSPEFLGLRSNGEGSIIGNGNGSENVIIGVMDTGIWPERRSFSDKGLGPVPKWWRGRCDGGKGFDVSLCNRKLIGVRYFLKGHEAIMGGEDDRNSARDWAGHGTHTASIAAGRLVENASFFGYATGNSSGIAPKARIAMYKVCGLSGGCADSDVVAGIDAAISDGVDVISMSLGGPMVSYDSNGVAIAAFAAVKKGIFFSAAAGNDGPNRISVENQAPWMTTVGSGTIDRAFPADVVLGDGRVFTGSSLYTGKSFEKSTYFPLYYPGNLSDPVSGYGYCAPDLMDPELVKGRIVVCDWGSPVLAEYVRKAGGAGTVGANVAPRGDSLEALPFLSPGLVVTESARGKILKYLNSSKTHARATIRFHGTRLGISPAPMVSSFSSRGPNNVSVDVLKPDLIAPGSNILAAWPDGVPPSDAPNDKRRTEFNIISGTSMSCPHVSGIAALLKGAHPEWTPAMIKSAMMTTAYTNDLDGNRIKEDSNHTKTTPWEIGAGHVDPNKADDPGLVYDLTVDDYIGFLCASKYTSRQIEVITGESHVDCQKHGDTKTWDLNYPAIVAFVDVSSSGHSISASRRVTHVSEGEAAYTVKIASPGGTNVSVEPEKMVFRNKGETQSYTVKISSDNPQGQRDGSEFGVLTWTDGNHNVTSPLVVVWMTQK